MGTGVNLITALAAGLLSFASPCVLPLIPAYLCFLTGSSLEELRNGTPTVRASLLGHALAFCLGFSLVFIAAGLAIGSAGSALQYDKVWLARGGGILAIVLGLQMLGVLKLTTLMRDRRVQLGRGGPRNALTSLLIGVGFAAGWSPCIGPILAGILLLAAHEDRLQAALLLSAYSVGLALPFLATALALTSALVVIRRLGRYVRYVEVLAGVVLVAAGTVLVLGPHSQLVAPFAHLIGFS